MLRQKLCYTFSMNRIFDSYALVVGRILVGAFFLLNGILYSLNLSETSKQFAGSHMGGLDPITMAILAIALQVLGGIAIIADFKTRYAAMMLAIYFIAATALFYPAIQDPSVANFYLKNMALIGALLYIAATSE
jgi:putative oxidoreductase